MQATAMLATVYPVQSIRNSPFRWNRVRAAATVLSSHPASCCGCSIDARSARCTRGLRCCCRPGWLGPASTSSTPLYSMHVPMLISFSTCDSREPAGAAAGSTSPYAWVCSTKPRSNTARGRGRQDWHKAGAATADHVHARQIHCGRPPPTAHPQQPHTWHAPDSQRQCAAKAQSVRIRQTCHLAAVADGASQMAGSREEDRIRFIHQVRCIDAAAALLLCCCDRCGRAMACQGSDHIDDSTAAAEGEARGVSLCMQGMRRQKALAMMWACHRSYK